MFLVYITQVFIHVCDSELTSRCAYPNQLTPSLSFTCRSRSRDRRRSRSRGDRRGRGGRSPDDYGYVPRKRVDSPDPVLAFQDPFAALRSQHKAMDPAESECLSHALLFALR